MKFRKKPVVIEATQWEKNGDHPQDDSCFVASVYGDYLSEGKVVRHFRRPDVSGDSLCPGSATQPSCGHFMQHHGWIETIEGGHIVCPGDWIITGIKGERYPCKPDIFEATYEPVTE